MRILDAILVSGFAAGLCGCGPALHALVGKSETIQGSGKATTMEVAVEPFTAIEAQAVIAARVVVEGDATKVTIHGDDNIVPLVIAESREGTLRLGMKPDTSIRPVTPLLVEVTTPSLTSLKATGAAQVTVSGGMTADRASIEVDGAAQVTVEDLTAQDLNIEASGAGQATIQGTAKSVRVAAGGAAKVLADKLQAETAHVEASGASEIAVNASQDVSGEATGASTIRVLGDPPRSNVNGSAAARVVVQKSE